MLAMCIEAEQDNHFYDLLGVQRSADQKEIRKAFKKLALSKHPDKNTVSLKLSIIAASYIIQSIETIICYSFSLFLASLHLPYNLLFVYRRTPMHMKSSWKSIVHMRFLKMRTRVKNMTHMAKKVSKKMALKTDATKAGTSINKTLVSPTIYIIFSYPVFFWIAKFCQLIHLAIKL